MTVPAGSDRRKALANKGIFVPCLYYCGKGVILEEYIQYDLPFYLSISDKKTRELIVFQAIKYMQVIVRLGFNSIDVFRDLRCRDKELVPIDFGEDLGGFGDSNKKHYRSIISKMIEQASEFFSMSEMEKIKARMLEVEGLVR